MTVWRYDRFRGLAAILLAAAASVIPAGIGFGAIPVYADQEQGLPAEFISDDYISLNEAMTACGFAKRPGYAVSYGKKISGQPVTITFDFNQLKCTKNAYAFSLDSQWREADGQYLVDSDLLEDITNHTFYYSDSGRIEAAAQQYGAYDWLSGSAPLIAHAGGAVRMGPDVQTYANSLAAIAENYTLGHRIFELDFQVTADSGLAAVHDGVTAGNENGIFMNTAEWQATGGTTIGDVLDQMMINTDMFIVTDTKRYDIVAFQIIYDEAAKRDINLLNRIIPQIYTCSMYDEVMAVYDFPSLIFTTYNTSETPEEIVGFVSRKENVRVITTPAGEEGVSRQLTQLANQTGILVYAHTLNDYEDIGAMRAQGVYGLYTDLLVPSDFERYENSRQNKE